MKKRNAFASFNGVPAHPSDEIKVEAR
jgi:hypothetical protein